MNSRPDARRALLERVLSRRALLADVYTGLAGIGLATLLCRELEAAPAGGVWRPGEGRPQFPARAKRVLQVFCPGAASHLDLWDYKPELEKRDGQPLPGEEGFVSSKVKNDTRRKTPGDFAPPGGSGKPISSLLPHMARHVDDIAFVHSMTS